MRRPTFLRVYSSDATEKADEATPINRSDSDDVRNSIDNNELHLYTELHNDEQMLMFRPTMALEGPVARSYFDGTWPWQCAVVFCFCFWSHAVATRGAAVGINLAQSQLVTLAAAAAIHLVVPAALGAYAGMIDPRLAPNWGWITLHASLAVVGWLALSRYKLLNGVGGRLGTMTYVTGNVATFLAIAAGDVACSAQIKLSRRVSAGVSATVESWPPRHRRDVGHWLIYAQVAWDELSCCNYEKRVARVASVGTCVAVVFCAVLTRLVSQFLGGTRWGSPVAAGAFVSFALMLCISVSGYKHAAAVELGLGVGSFVSMGSTSLLPETSDVAAAAALAAGFVLLLLPIQVHPPGGKQGLTAVLGSLAWAGVRRLLFRPPDARG